MFKLLKKITKASYGFGATVSDRIAGALNFTDPARRVVGGAADIFVGVSLLSTAINVGMVSVAKMAVGTFLGMGGIGAIAAGANLPVAAVGLGLAAVVVGVSALAVGCALAIGGLGAGMLKAFGQKAGMIKSADAEKSAVKAVSCKQNVCPSQPKKKGNSLDKHLVKDFKGNAAKAGVNDNKQAAAKNIKASKGVKPK